MAGGIGSRFWPISRTSRPKQFLDILGTGKTLIRSTFERFLDIVPVENFIVVTNRAYKDLVLEQIPELEEHQVLTEPVGRNTAPCIAYAAFRLNAIDAGSDMIVTPSDHLIMNTAEFAKVINQSIDFINQERDAMMTIGIQPNHPNTGYGYIQVDTSEKSEDDIFKVKTFTEKPNLELAKTFVETGEFFWNSGIFIWKTDTILDQFAKLLPEMYMLFKSINKHYNTPTENEHIKQIYPECRGISIDFGIMEKAQNVYVRRSDFGWSDLGTWGSLYQYSQKDENGNVLPENNEVYNTSNSIIKTSNRDKLMVVEGLDGYIVVDTDDVLMICPRENEQNIKKYIEEVKFSKGEKFI